MKLKLRHPSKEGTTYYSLANQRHYDAWEIVRSGVTSGDPKGRYCANLGHKQDDESGLVYMRARYYEPATGRFLTEDPAGYSLNGYSFANNNPINLVDQDGKSFAWVEFIFGLLIFLTGLFLLGIVVPDLETKIAQLTYTLSKYGNLEMIASVTKNLEELQETKASLQAGLGRLQSGQAAAAVIGYMMVITGLLIDIDSDGGFDILTTVFG